MAHSWAKLARWRIARRWGAVALLLCALIACQGATGLTFQAITYGEPSSPECADSMLGLFAPEPEPAYEEVVVTCAGWTLHVPFGVDVTLRTAVSVIRTPSPGGRQVIPIDISPDGHRVAYLDVRQLRYLATDLRGGSARPITPVLTAEELVGITSVVSSADGRHFAVSTRANRRTFVTDFETGRTRTLDRVCFVYGLDDDRLVGNAACNGDADKAVSIRSDGAATPFRPPTAVRDLSPDLRRYIGFDGFSIFDTSTGRLVKRLPAGLEPLMWADSDTLVARDDDVVAVDATTGEQTPTGIPYSSTVVFGKVR
ncbi:hypothetical protein [Streptosporangium carneum]|uniref:Uncharacterized protein n=1 Tax=Streptosporangium carneum TaxID=47481 RepID=A0A9W6MED7_9ACTN|nr:hypothetical protein [Streptosporangium carneum]GLK11096.1 hypothetical protein GCM10017600_45020 [Streptosporangium carneum]